MMEEINASALMQEELRKIDPTLASASSFLSVVTEGAGRKKNAQPAKVAAVAAEVLQIEVNDADVVTDKAGDGHSVVSGTEMTSTHLSGQQKPTARYLEKKRTT